MGIILRYHTIVWFAQLLSQQTTEFGDFDKSISETVWQNIRDFVFSDSESFSYYFQCRIKFAKIHSHLRWENIFGDCPYRASFDLYEANNFKVGNIGNLFWVVTSKIIRHLNSNQLKELQNQQLLIEWCHTTHISCTMLIIPCACESLRMKSLKIPQMDIFKIPWLLRNLDISKNQLTCGTGK